MGLEETGRIDEDWIHLAHGLDWLELL